MPLCASGFCQSHINTGLSSEDLKHFFHGVTVFTLNIILIQLHGLRKKMKFLMTAVVLEQGMWIRQASLENSLTVSGIFYLGIIGRSGNSTCRHARVSCCGQRGF